MIVTFTNRKGGVGKSTMAVHTAAGLATLGYNVGLVDTDSQGHSGLMLGQPEADGLFTALIDKRPLEQCVLSIAPEIYSTSDNPSRGNLHLLPSGQRTYQIPLLKPDESFLFIETVEAMIERYQLHVVIVDTSPTMSQFDGPIYLASDAFIYVTECERLSLDGVVAAVEQMRRFAGQRKRYLQRESSIIGIIPNKVRDTMVHKRNIKALRENFGSLTWSPVALRTLWTEASNLQQTVFTYAPTGREAADAWQIVRKVEGALWPQTVTQP